MIWTFLNGVNAGAMLVVCAISARDHEWGGAIAAALACALSTLNAVLMYRRRLER